ncbi:MAG: putative alpha/beta-fold hydrolase [Gammaproteobacteria bacterium]|jgi:predicted alpha/beta-fold hydrolase
MQPGSIVPSDFNPAWWLPDPHSQTLWQYFFRRKIKLELISERLELPDGDFVDLCWTTNTTGPLIAVFHGLEGDITSPYSNAIMHYIHTLRWRAVFMHFRSCSGEMNRLERSYHSGETDDIRFLIQVLQTRYPDVPIATVGYSLGGNALLKYLGESGAASRVVASVAVSVPYLLHDSAISLSKGLSRFYQWRLVRSLQDKVRKKFIGKKSTISINTLHKLTTFYKFDENITAPLHGFKSADEYYFKSSCRQYLSKIRAPTLLLHAKNDPFMSISAIPKAEELSDTVILELSDKGGHVGFVGGIVPWKAEYWLEERITNFLKHYIS